MGWSGRAPAPPASEAGKGRQRQGARHVPDTQYRDRRDRHRYRQELVPRRGPRCARRHRAAAKMVAWPSGSAARQYTALPDRYGSLRRRTSLYPQTRIAWSRCQADAGQICPPYSKGQKNDFNDAEAIAEAVQRPTMKFVATKTAEQLDLQALHRVRERLVSQRPGIIDQIRPFMLERGIAVRQGIGFLRTELPTILATRTDALSPRMLRVIEELAGDWRRLDQRIEGLSSEIEALARQDQACPRLMTVPGIGPIISSAMVAAIGTGDVFSKGRDFGAWLGLVPKQISTGDRTILGKISRRGKRYLRVLFVQAAWVVLVRIKDWERYGLKSWIEAAKRRLHHNVLAIALANKLARIAWAVLAKGRAFECVKTNEMASRPA